MRNFFRKLAACLCAVTLIFSIAGALAEFSPRLEAMREGDLAIRLSGSYESLSALSKESLEIVNQWLSKLQLIVKGSAGGSLTGAALLSGEEELWSFTAGEQQNGDVVTVFSPSGNSFLTAAEQQQPLSLLTGSEPHLYDALELPRYYGELANQLFPLLASKTEPKFSRSSTSIKNASASSSYETYTFSAEEMNALWPEIRQLLLPGIKGTLTDQPALCARAEEVLSQLQFTGECRVKRFLDKEGGDMGLQFTGNAALGEEVRKITVFGGFTAGKGGYFSFSAPAVKGKNTLKYSLTGKLTEKKSGLRTLEIEGSFSRTMNGASQAATLNFSLKNSVKEETEAWSGKITSSRTENKVKTTYTLTPDLTFSGEGLRGTVKVQRKTGSTADMKALLNLSVTSAETFTQEIPEDVRDLREMDDARAKTAVQAELPALTGIVVRLMSALPEEARTLLTHELRTDEWMTGENIPVTEEDKTPEDETPGDETDPALPDAQDPEDEWIDLPDDKEDDMSDEAWMDGDGWFNDDDDDFAQEEAAEDAGDEEEMDPPPEQEEPEETPAPTAKPTESPEQEDLFDDDWYGEDWFEDT